jgi:GNAT superfamily N-acetyltransferase
MNSFVDFSLARRLERGLLGRSYHYARAYQNLHPEAEVVTKDLAGGQLIFCAPGSPLNRAIGLGFDRPIEPADLDTIEGFYHSRECDPRVDLCPLADPSLLRTLCDRGYTLERFFNLLYAPLSPKTTLVKLPKGLRIEQVDTQDAALWLRTTGQGFEETDQPSAEILNILSPNFYSENAICFLAWMNDIPAGGGGMYIHEGVAELGGASTRPAFRRMGIQTALLQVRMTAAHKIGCNYAIVMTSPGSTSQRNIQRAGLRLAYSRAIMRTNG